MFNMSKIITFISIFRLENSFKNILIFFPFLISEKNFFSSSLIDLCFGFIIFTTLTSICYATNDYSDQKGYTIWSSFFGAVFATFLMLGGAKCAKFVETKTFAKFTVFDDI